MCLDHPYEDPEHSSGMADRGMGIRLFNSKAMLAKIFEEFECEDSDGEEGENGAIEGTAVVTSQLRHFVLQVSWTHERDGNLIEVVSRRNMFLPLFYWTHQTCK